MPNRYQRTGQDPYAQHLRMLLAAASAASGTVGALWIGGWPERILYAAWVALAGGLGCLVLWLSMACSIDRRHTRRRTALEVRKRARVAERVAERRRFHIRERSWAALSSARATAAGEAAEDPGRAAADPSVTALPGASSDAGAPEARPGLEAA